MKHINLFFLIGILGLASRAYGDTGKIRIKQNINREWKFMLEDVPNAQDAHFDDSNWSAIHLPHSFSIPYFMWTQVYHGYGWYRKTINVPAEWKDRNITLEFEGAFIEKEVYVNGNYLGKHVGGYTGFFFDITDHLHPGENTIAVRINNLWKPDVAPRTGDHQFSGGIYRDVYLNVTDKLHVDMYGTFVYTPTVSEETAVCEIQTEIRNNYQEDKTCQVKTEIRSPKGKVVARTKSSGTIKKASKEVIKQTLPAISRPELWSPESPSLYKAVTTVTIDGKVADRYETDFGIRWFDWTADKGFFLNGKHYYLWGANVHQDQAGWGDAVTNASMRRDIQLLKDAGFNCIRGSHYPHDPDFVRACSEIGMIYFQENAFWGMGGGTGDSFDWCIPSSCYPPNAKDQPGFDQSVLSQLKEMIKIHRNSASIAAWSLSNEPFFTDGSTSNEMHNLLNLSTDSARVWDPTREAAVGGAQRGGIDQLGKNAIAFYNGDGASLYQNPGVPNLVSEYGCTPTYRPGTFDPYWKDLVWAPEGNNDPWNPPAWRSGQIFWCAFDHGTIAGDGLATTGLIDYFRIPKRQYYWYVEALKHRNPHPAEPEWPKEGIPAKLKLEASNTLIRETNGTDDTRLFITVLDATGKHISNNVPIQLTILSGPGEFPTGRSIRFMPPSHEEASDIVIRDGQTAITFRSYYAGNTVIQASAEGLEPATVELKTEGTPAWKEGMDVSAVNRPYARYRKTVQQQADPEKMLLGIHRPSWVSSTMPGTSKAHANDNNDKTIWMPEKGDKEKWYKLDLEAAYCVNRIQLELPEANTRYEYKIELSRDGSDWKEIIRDKVHTTDSKMRTYSGNYGCMMLYVRITFLSEQAGLAEIRVGGY